MKPLHSFFTSILRANYIERHITLDQYVNGRYLYLRHGTLSSVLNKPQKS